MIVELLLISAVVMMIFESGWWDNMDEIVNRKFKFHHLPKIFVCQFCQTFWLSLLWLFFTYEISVLSVFLALLNANVGEILLPLFKLLKGAVNKVIEWMISKLY